MGVECVAFSLHLLVPLEQVVVVEPEVVLLLARNHQLVLSVSQSGLPFENLSVQVSVSGVFCLGLSGQIILVAKLSVQISLKGLGLGHQSGVVILGSGEFSLGGVESLVGSSQLELLGVCKL